MNMTDKFKHRCDLEELLFRFECAVTSLALVQTTIAEGLGGQDCWSKTLYSVWDVMNNLCAELDSLCNELSRDNQKEEIHQ